MSINIFNISKNKYQLKNYNLRNIIFDKTLKNPNLFRTDQN